MFCEENKEGCQAPQKDKCPRAVPDTLSLLIDGNFREHVLSV
jgi:hypothetical protein